MNHNYLSLNLPPTIYLRNERNPYSFFSSTEIHRETAINLTKMHIQHSAGMDVQNVNSTDRSPCHGWRCSFLVHMLKLITKREQQIQVFIFSFNFPDKSVYDRLWETTAMMVIGKCQCWDAECVIVTLIYVHHFDSRCHHPLSSPKLFLSPYTNPTPKPTHHRKLSAF